MLIHGSTCLRGPVTQSDARWAARGRYVTPRPSETAPIRHDLVARVRGEIAAGTYDTPERFEAALIELLDRHHRS